jgi:hypothetical protein
VTPDIEIDDQGSIVLFKPVSSAASQWWDRSVECEDWQRIGEPSGGYSYAVDRRMAHAIYIGLVEAGFDIKGVN